MSSTAWTYLTPSPLSSLISNMNPETLSLPPSACSASNSPTASVAASGNNMSKETPPAASSKDKEPPETKGWLYKWTNYIKGYQKRWFVLANGLLSYYRNQAEMAHTCRGTISLHGAHIHTEDSCNFIVSNGGGTQTFHLRASSEVNIEDFCSTNNSKVVKPQSV